MYGMSPDLYAWAKSWKSSFKMTTMVMVWINPPTQHAIVTSKMTVHFQMFQDQEFHAEPSFATGMLGGGQIQNHSDSGLDTISGITGERWRELSLKCFFILKLIDKRRQETSPDVPLETND